MVRSAGIGVRILVLIFIAAAAHGDCGTLLTSWGTAGAGDGQFNYLWGVATDANGNVYVADTNNNRIEKFDGNGAFIAKWGTFGTGNGQFDYPVGVTTDASGNVYVTEGNNSRIQKFDSSGAFITKWGSFSFIEGVATDLSGNVYAVDYGAHRISKFNGSGTLLTTWGGLGNADGQLAYPRAVGTDLSGNVYVADGGHSQIQKFDGNGTFLTKWGSFGTGDGQFDQPTGIGTDSSGNVYVADVGNHRIQKFNSNGTFLAKWGSRGSGPGQFEDPVSLAVDASGSIFVTDSGNSRIQKFSCADACDTGSPGCGNGRIDPGETCDDGNTTAGDGCNADCTQSSTDYQLLSRFLPILRYDRDELYISLSVEALVASPGSYLEREDGTRVSNPPMSTLNGRYGDGVDASSDDVLVPAAISGCDSACTSARWYNCHGSHVYGRVTLGRRQSTWLQYWYFHYRRTLEADTRRGHEGDWQLIQVHVPRNATVPDVMFYSQQDAGEQCSWGQMETVSGRPVLYVAAGSHGSYKAQGTTLRDEGFDDEHRGDGESPVPTLELITGRQPAWVTWPGRWGSTDGSAFVSPLGPAFADAGGPWDHQSDLDWEQCQ